MTDTPLTRQEQAAIAALQRIARTWPRTLTLASMGGDIVVIRTADPRFINDNGRRDDAVIADINGIPNTGGDW